MLKTIEICSQQGKALFTGLGANSTLSQKCVSGKVKCERENKTITSLKEEFKKCLISLLWRRPWQRET